MLWVKNIPFYTKCSVCVIYSIFLDKLYDIFDLDACGYFQSASKFGRKCLRFRGKLLQTYFIKFLPLYNKVFTAAGLGKSNFKDQYGPGTYYTKLWRSGILAVFDCMSPL